MKVCFWSLCRPWGEKFFLFCAPEFPYPQTGPLPILRSFYTSGSERITLYMPTKLKKVFIRFHGKGFESSLIHMSIPFPLITADALFYFLVSAVRVRDPKIPVSGRAFAD